MPLGVGSGLWGVILPKEITNLATNPSMEYGTAGWSALAGGASIGSTSYTQAFGAWSLQVNHTVTSEGAFLNMGTPAAGSYSLSAYVEGTAGHHYRLLAESAGGAVLGAGSVTAVAGWQPIVALFGLASGTGLNIVIRHIDAAIGTLYLDGVQLESGTFPTTYIDGDQPGGTWLGTAHNSTTFRTGQYRGGGSLIALSDLGMQVDQMVGAGVMPIEVSSQSYAVVDGAEFQRQRGAQRKFTLTAKPISGTSLADFHVTRRAVFDAFKPDLVTPQQPVRFVYVGGQGTQFIDAYYQSGMELGNMDGPIAESMGVSFIATNPYWYGQTQSGTALAPRVSIGSTNFIAKRSPQGQWGTLGANGSTVAYSLGAPTARALLYNPGGTLFIGGNWGTVAGTLSPMLGMYFPASNTFGTMTGGTMGFTEDGVYTFAQSPSGTLFIGGGFSAIAGTTTFSVARWGPSAFGTLQGGTVRGAGVVVALLYSPTGTLVLGGDFGTVGGTNSANDVAFWTGAYGTLGAGGVGSTVGEGVNCLAWGLDNRLYIGGAFTNVGGTIGTSIGFFKNGAFGTMGNVFGNKIVNGLSVGVDGRLYEGGFFSGILPTGSLNNVAVWNGVQHSAMGSGLGDPASSNLVHCTYVDPQTGNVYMGGAFSVVGGINVTSNYAQWNGYTWLLPDIAIGSPGTIWAITKSQDNTLYIAGGFSGTARVASVSTIVNPGRAQVYPSLRLRNLSTGTARVYQLLNTTTGDGLYFNYTMLPSENAVLTLTPGTRSFTSSFQGNILGDILPGSNLATWNLLPGTNYVSFFSDNDSLEVSLYWQNRGWSIDSGTIY